MSLILSLIQPTVKGKSEHGLYFIPPSPFSGTTVPPSLESHTTFKCDSPVFLFPSPFSVEGEVLDESESPLLLTADAPIIERNSSLDSIPWKFKLDNSSTWSFNSIPVILG